MTTKKPMKKNSEDGIMEETKNDLKADMAGKFGETSREISLLIRSKQPVIYLHSNESEDRILRIINSICQGDLNTVRISANIRSLFIWDAVNGLTSREFHKNSSKILTVSAETKDPMSVLDHIINADPSVPACFVLCEFHHFLDNPTVMRRLRNFTETAAQKQHKNIILLSPDNNGMSRDGKMIPPELESIIYMIDWPIPDEVVLRKVFEDEVFPSANAQIVKANETLAKNGKPQKPTLNLSEEQVDNIVKSAKGLTIHEARTSAYRSLVEHFAILPEVILSSKKQIVKKKGLIDYIEPKSELLDDLGGMKNLKNWLKARKPILSDDARDFGCDLPNGVMLLGPWGTGKSSVAKAIINEWGLPGLRIDAAKLMESFVGSSERNTASTLKLADSIAPCILWWDEVDDLFSGSESSTHSDGGTTSRVIGIISTWMAEHEGLVFNVFTANDISHRPPKLFRKGRIDEIFIVDLPVESERKDIFKIHIDKRRDNNFSKKIDLDILAKESRMFSGAEIREAVNSGFITAFNDKRREIKTEDILAAIKATIPISCTMKEQLSGMRKWQEGRAVRASDNRPDEIIDVEEYRKIGGVEDNSDAPDLVNF